MTSARHLALMALMREIEEPSKTYFRSVRQASAAFTDSPEWDRAVARGSAALDAVDRAVRLWTETNRPQPVPGLCGTPSPDRRFVCALEPHGIEELHADRRKENAGPSGARMVWETPVELPDGFERHSCVSVACAVCGEHYVDPDEGGDHFMSAAEAATEAVGGGWDELKDGRVVCGDRDEKHEALRSEVGVVNDSDDA